MKKILLLAVLLTGICSFSFANIMLQAEDLACGITFENLTNSGKTTKDSYFTPINCPGVFLGYEFNSNDTESKNHLYTGVNSSLFIYGIYTAPVIGWNYNLCNLGPVNLEFDLSAALGPVWNVLGGASLYNQYSTSILFEGHSRRGIYGGLGVSAAMLYDMNLKAQAPYFSLYTFVGGRVFIGFKF